MKYKGFFKAVNKKPSGDYIEVFVSDWNKDYWAFYSYIEKDNYETDLEEINELIKKLNYRDGDVYIELIDFNGELDGFYHYIYDANEYTHSSILNPEYWEILEEKGDFHFKCFTKMNGSNDLQELKDIEYSVFSDWYEVLETFHPDLYKALDESNGLCCFDIEHFFNCQGFTEIDDCIVC